MCGGPIGRIRPPIRGGISGPGRRSIYSERFTPHRRGPYGSILSPTQPNSAPKKTAGVADSRALVLARGGWAQKPPLRGCETSRRERRTSAWGRKSTLLYARARGGLAAGNRLCVSAGKAGDASSATSVVAWRVGSGAWRAYLNSKFTRVSSEIPKGGIGRPETHWEMRVEVGVSRNPPGGGE